MDFSRVMNPGTGQRVATRRDQPIIAGVRPPAMRILLAGASGLIGRALTQFWGSQGHEIHRLVREEARQPNEVFWDPIHGHIPRYALEGFDAAVCLSGAGIFDARWTTERKAELRSSRITPAGLLARTLAHCARKPKCLVCASATGVYGVDRGAEVLTETSEPGTDFIARLCLEWEAAVAPASNAGIRIAHLRSGVVLTPKAGALKKLLLPFRLGIGGTVGSGQQFFSWLTLDEIVGIIDFIVQTDTIGGAIVAVSPNPVTNKEFTAALGHAVRRPAIIPVPAFAVRAALGEMADLVLGSIRVYPRKLEATGYQFRHPALVPALDAMVGPSSTVGETACPIPEDNLKNRIQKRQ
jgi:uncharacterized protein (TIGR01777 family)